MEEADKDWMMIRMVGGRVCLLIPDQPGSAGQRAVKWLLYVCTHGIFMFVQTTSQRIDCDGCAMGMYHCALTDITDSCTQIWVSYSDGSRTVSGSEF